MTRMPAVLASLVALLGCSSHEEPEPRPVVAVKVATAALEDVQRTVHAPALIHPRQQAAIASRLTAAVRELQVRKGDRVRAGQLLARLENRDILAQRAEAEAALHQAQALAASRTRLFDSSRKAPSRNATSWPPRPSCSRRRPGWRGPLPSSVSPSFSAPSTG